MWLSLTSSHEATGWGANLPPPRLHLTAVRRLEQPVGSPSPGRTVGLLGQGCLLGELGCCCLLITQEGVAVTRPSCPRSGAGAALQGPSRLVCHSAAGSGGGVQTESGGLSPRGRWRHHRGHHGGGRAPLGSGAPSWWQSRNAHHGGLAL